MEAEERAEGAGTQQPERRSSRRLAVDEASVVLLLGHGLPMECRVLDLSLEGCRIRTRERFAAGSRAHIEACFKINGIAFRFSGVTQWTDGGNLVGIRFENVPVRRREELAEVLSELEAAEAAKAAKAAKAREQAAQEEAERLAREQAAREAAERLARQQEEARRAAERAKLRQDEAQLAAQQKVTPQPFVRPQPVAMAKPIAVAQPVEMPKPAETKPPAKPAARERRAQSRHEVDTSAVIFLINIGSQLHGRIRDLSAGGCRIRTDERFPVGIYTRVETEFRVDGLPFRLGGVIQAIHDRERLLVGIRFLDMSPRKREQLEQLIEEVAELDGKREGTGNRE
jgi:chemotaxis protein histidine kinase CheA